MKVLVGIPTFRRADQLAKLLRSIARQRISGDVEPTVYVVDNDPAESAGATLAGRLAPDFPFPLSSVVIAEPGISAVRNAILDRAKETESAYVAMIDDDEWAEEQWLSSLIGTARKFDADVVAGRRIFEFETEPCEEILSSGAFDHAVPQTGLVDFVYTTANVAVSLAALRRFGNPKFDAAFGLTGGGDTEFFARIKKRGARFAFCAEAVSYELVPASRLAPGWVLRRAYRSGNGQIRIALLHRSWSDAIAIGGRGLAMLALSPIYAALLASRRRRLWVLRKWAMALGRVSGPLGRHYREYELEARTNSNSCR